MYTIFLFLLLNDLHQLKIAQENTVIEILEKIESFNAPTQAESAGVSSEVINDIKMALEAFSDRTEVTINTFVHIDFELEHIPPREESEHGSQRTDVPAPESLSGHVEERDAHKDQSDKEPLEENGVDVEVFEELNQSISQRRQAELIEDSHQVWYGKAEDRKDTDGEWPH